MKKRVVITGMGAVSPIGCGIDKIWKNCREGYCGIAPLTKEEYKDYPVKIGGEIKDLNKEDYLTKRDIKFASEFITLARIAARKAFADAGFSTAEEKIPDTDFGVMITSAVGGADVTEEGVLTDRIGPFFIPGIIINSASSYVAMDLHAHGCCYAPVSSCASSSHAIGEAFRKIAYGEETMILAGGSDYPFTDKTLKGFAVMQAVYKGEDVEKGCIPFDVERKGFVPGEGAAVLVLEELGHAVSRGAHIYGEITGYGSSCDACHPTAPAPDGKYAAIAMKKAIEDAGIDEGEIGYINAHGTGTKMNDLAESNAIRIVFSDSKKSPFVSSTKSMTGHMLGAAGAMEAILCLKALEDGFMPGTVHLKNPDPDCPLNLGCAGRRADIQYAMSNSFGFGGHNVSLVFGKWAGIENR